jgi:hypothetical protein
MANWSVVELPRLTSFVHPYGLEISACLLKVNEPGRIVHKQFSYNKLTCFFAPEKRLAGTNRETGKTSIVTGVFKRERAIRRTLILSSRSLAAAGISERGTQ